MNSLPQDLLKLKILIVDDEPVNVSLMERILDGLGYTNFKGISDSRLALPTLCEYQPDLIMLDLMMPYLDGFAVMEQVAQVVPASTYLPILVLTADANRETRSNALRSGATDFLTKPFDYSEVVLRIRNLLRTRLQYLQLQDQNYLLDQKVQERTRELQEAQAEMLSRLAQAAEFRDDTTGQHTGRVGHLAALLAQALGLPEETVTLIRKAAQLHDVGKIGISDSILLRPDKLSEEEFAIMKTHTAVGAALLRDGHSDIVKMAEEIALNHHERWDGSGYPCGLSGEDIPLTARIVSIVDLFDALTHERPYKKAWTLQAAVEEIEGQTGRQFDPRLVAAFLELISTLEPDSSDSREASGAGMAETMPALGAAGW